MKGRQGVLVEEVRPRGPAALAGIERGDSLVSINGHPLTDNIDYLFHGNEQEMTVVLRRGGKRHSVLLQVPEGEDPGLEPGHFKVRTCRNKCIFCFVSQLPRGLRKTLYVKDEDYRMSFLYGNYITMTNLSAQDKKRIALQRLSPLYISVHSTNRALRNRMLGNPKAHDVMGDLRFLKENKIRMHVQIVLCPGLNDGRELAKTIRDLYSLYPYLLSVAVVPVGLTAHRKTEIRPVEREDAEKALDAVGAFQRRFRKRHGDPIVYGADELYIKAGRAFPPLKDYGDLPQIENGVGMVPLFQSGARRIRPPQGSGLRYLTFTGVSFYPFLKRFTERLEKAGINMTALPIENAFFGPSVTVAGLITGRDVIRAVSDRAGEYDMLLIPDVVLREGNDVFLDNVSVRDIEKVAGIRAKTVESTPEGLLRGATE